MDKVKQIFLRRPPKRSPTPAWKRAARRIVGSLLSPLFLGWARLKGYPGVSFHLALSRLLLSWAASQPLAASRRFYLARLATEPMGLTRYQEFDFAWQALPSRVTQFLDVSSPSLFPLRLASARPAAKGWLLNPDNTDLEATRQLSLAGGLQGRLELMCCSVEQFTPPGDVQFDLITCISVLEHILDPRPALRRLWNWLAPGGTLILTLPCAAEAAQVFVDFDPYGLSNAEAGQPVFFEHLFDEAHLQCWIYSEIGQPVRRQLYGERHPGYLREKMRSLWSGQAPNFWSEPLEMGRNFVICDKIEDLQGEGVLCLAFQKPVH